MKAGRETVCLKHRRGGSASISRRLLRARGLLPPASSLAGLHPHPDQQPGPVRSVPTAPLVANPHSPHSSLLVPGRASTLGPLLLSGWPYGTSALNATPRQWLPHAYRRIRNLCGIPPSYRLFPPENPSRVFNEPRGLNADSAELPTVPSRPPPAVPPTSVIGSSDAPAVRAGHPRAEEPPAGSPRPTR